jgi:hypothetical protein
MCKLTLITMMIIVIFSVAFVYSWASYPEDVMVSDTTTDHIKDPYHFQTIRDGDYIYTIWQKDPTTGDDIIKFDKASQTGENYWDDWGIDKSVNDSEAGDRLLHPVIASYSEQYVYAVWKDDRAGGDDFELWFRKSTDNGSSWSGEKCIAWEETPESLDLIGRPSMAIDGDGNDIIVVFSANNPDWTLYYVHGDSPFSLNNWEEPVLLTSSENKCRYPCIMRIQPLFESPISRLVVTDSVRIQF